MKDLIINIAIFSSFLFFYNSLIPLQWAGISKLKWSRIMSQGIVMGLLGNILMFFSVHVNSTTIIDYRQLAVVCSALFGGALAALLASLIIGLGRVLLFGGFNVSSLIGVVSILLAGMTAGIVINRVQTYWRRWIAFVLLMIITSTSSFILILGYKSMTILPKFYAILLAGSCFVAYLLQYLIRMNNQQSLIKENEKRYRRLSSLQDAVFNSASEVSIIVTDPEGIITIFNHGAERMLGYTAEELIGKETPEKLHLESEVIQRGEELSKLFKRPIQGFDVFVEWTRHGKAEGREWTYVKKDGSHITVNMIVTALHYEGGISGFIGIGTDITGKKHAEAELHNQNEELQAQQAELEAQQEELLSALTKLEESESYLKKRNMLAISLFNTSDKKGLYQSIINSYVQLFGAQSGMIVMLHKEQALASFGLTEDEVSHLKLNRIPWLLSNLNEKKLPYSLARDRIYDLFIPILDEEMELIACIVLSRSHHAVSEREEEEAVGLATQIALSLQKLWMHDEAIQQRELTQDMLDTIQEGILLIDLKGNTLQVNTKFCELIGFDKAEIAAASTLSRYWLRLKLNMDQPQLLEDFVTNILRDPLQSSTSINYILNLPSKRNINMYYELLYKDGYVFGVLLVHRDVTIEFELDQLKSEFVSTVSHELRTPLSSIFGLTELMLTKELSPEKQHVYLSTIYDETNRLTTLINDFLDLQRMESGKKTYEFNSVDLKEIIYNVVDLYKIHSKNHEFTFHLQEKPVLVKGDRDNLKQIMMNLVSNALKYSPKGGKVDISASMDEGYWSISIKDEGLGIPADSINKLFSKFYRVDNSDRRQIGGTGLGLSIVKEIVTAHKGDVKAFSVYGEGSTFTFRIPKI